MRESAAISAAAENVGSGNRISAKVHSVSVSSPGLRTAIASKRSLPVNFSRIRAAAPDAVACPDE